MKENGLTKKNEPIEQKQDEATKNAILYSVSNALSTYLMV